MKNLNNKNTILISVLGFIIISSIFTAFILFIEKNRTSVLRRFVVEISSGYAHSIARQLDRSLSATLTLALVISNDDTIKNFNSRSVQIIKSYGGISSLRVAPNGVINQIFPLEGYEDEIGYDLLNEPTHRDDCLRTIESRELTLAGPFHNKEGGAPITARYPVFIERGPLKGKFWGFTIVQMELDLLFKASNINDLVKSGFNYEITSIISNSNKRQIIAQSDHEILNNPVETSIKVPNGEWFLSVSPKNGWVSTLPLSLEILISFLITVFITILLHQRFQSINELSNTNKLLTNEIVERKRVEEKRGKLVADLQKALSEVKTLRGILPICSYCKKIRNDEGYWDQIESYIGDHSEAEFSHGICQECAKKYYPDMDLYDDNGDVTKD